MNGVPEADGVIRVRVELRPDEDVDVDLHDRLTRGLRGELNELDVESIRAVPGSPAPEGAKSADPVTVGALLVAFSASGGVLTSLVGVLQDWLNRRSARHRIAVTIAGDSIELDRATGAERWELIDAFIRRHSGG
ncbi:effector-associated constant component EACC1 [Microbispora rosea]